MKKLTKNELERILTSGLFLVNPWYDLEKAPGGRWSGHIVSKTFKGKRDHKRQEMIWNTLTTALGAEAVRQVGMLLCYTPEEWNFGADQDSTPRKSKKVG